MALTKYWLSFLALTTQLVYSSQAAALVEAQRINNFPSINQRALPGAEDRCGTIALSEWLVWLTDAGALQVPLMTDDGGRSGIDVTSLPEAQQAVVSELDKILGGSGEISLLHLVGSLVEYVHRHSKVDAQLEMTYYNLPRTEFLRELVALKSPILLLHGIYERDSNTQQLVRVDGHYTCLIGKKSSHFLGQTYGVDYVFTLDDLPMRTLQPDDRYRSAGTESLVYLRFPESEYPRYHFRSFAPVDRKQASLQSNREGPGFAQTDQIILLEGALVFSIARGD